MESIVIAALAVASATLVYLLVVSRIRTRRVTQRFEVLDDIARVSDAASSLPETLTVISEVLVPQIADFCMIDVLSDGRAQRAGVRVGPGAPSGAEPGLAERQPFDTRAHARRRFGKSAGASLLRANVGGGPALDLPR